MESIEWIKDRAKERTSLDGGALIALSLLVLFAGPLIKIAAIAGLIWGIVTLFKKG
jgi:thiamine transporter ThiT